MSDQFAMLSCFDESCVMAEPWAEAGVLCYCVDLVHKSGLNRQGNIIRVGADMLDFIPPQQRWLFAMFFPPCTDVAVSGARWFRDKGLGRLIRSLTLFKRSVDIAEMLGCPYAIENPVSTVSKYWRQPDHYFDPCDYAGYQGGADDLYTKRTCLWTGGGFVMPAPNRIEPTQGSRMHLLPPSAERASLRSKTPAGFARAVFQSNCPSELRMSNAA